MVSIHNIDIYTKYKDDKRSTYGRLIMVLQPISNVKYNLNRRLNEYLKLLEYT